MPFLLVSVGLLAAITALNGTYKQFYAQLVKDFTGPGNFTYWVLAIGTVGSIGYVPALQKPSRVFLALVIISLVLSHGGFFEQLMKAIQVGPTQSGGQPLAAINTAPSVGSTTPTAQVSQAGQQLSQIPLGGSTITQSEQVSADQLGTGVAGLF